MAEVIKSLKKESKVYKWTLLKRSLRAQMQKIQKRPSKKHLAGSIHSLIGDMVNPDYNAGFPTSMHAEDKVV